MTPTKSVSKVELNGKSATKSALSFQEMLDALRAEFGRADKKVNVDELWRILEAYKSDPDDWKNYAHYDMLKYKRNLVDEDENYNVMIIGWGPATKSCIHDHSGSHCFMKVSLVVKIRF